MKHCLIISLVLLISGCSSSEADKNDRTSNVLEAFAKYEGIVKTLSTPTEFCGVFNLEQNISTYSQVHSTLASYKYKKIMLIMANMLMNNEDPSGYLKKKEEELEKIKYSTAMSLEKYRGLDKESPECYEFLNAIDTIDDAYFKYGAGSYHRTANFQPNYLLLTQEEVNLLTGAYIEEKVTSSSEYKRR